MQLIFESACKFQVAYLAVIGGKSEDETIERVLGVTIANGLARKFNWCGVKSKQAFGKLEICNVIFGLFSC
jgi:hypothetical protein